MISTWFNYFVNMVGDLISFLDSVKIIGVISVLHILIVTAVAGILTGTFLSVARR